MACAWLLALLIIGDRNTFFLIVLSGISAVYTYLRSMSRKLIFIGVCGALFFLYQVIEISRKAESRDIRGIIDAFYLTADENENELEISSFDITTIGNRATFKIFDEKRKFFYGKFKLISLTSIIPYSSRLFVDNNDYYNKFECFKK